MAKSPKYTVRRYEGDDIYSWAVFKDLPKGLPNIISYGEAKPILCGLSRSTALYEKKCLEDRAKAQKK